MELAPRQLDALDAGMTVERMEFRTRQLEELEACVERTTEELGELPALPFLSPIQIGGFPLLFILYLPITLLHITTVLPPKVAQGHPGTYDNL
jgi:hypothetical protein